MPLSTEMKARILTHFGNCKKSPKAPAAQLSPISGLWGRRLGEKVLHRWLLPHPA